MTLSSTESAYRLRSRQVQRSSEDEHDDMKRDDRRRMVDEGNEPENHGYWWNSNGRLATNDSDEDIHEKVNIVDGYPVDYSCDGTLNNRIPIQPLEIRYDYEVSILAGADLPANLRSLEWSTLWNVAETIGLHKCDFSKQNSIPNNDVTRNSNRNLLLVQESYIVEVSSIVKDTIDQTNDSCTLLVETVPGTMCTPIQGVMTAYYAGAQTDEIRNYLLDVIAIEMNSGRVITDEVSAVRFVGDRAALVREAESIEANNRREEQPVPSSGVGSNLYVIVAIVVLASAVVVMLVLVVLKKRRASRAEELVEASKCEVDEDLNQKDTSSNESLIEGESIIDLEDSVATTGMEEEDVSDQDESSITPLPDNKSTIEEVRHDKSTIEEVRHEKSTIEEVRHSEPAESSEPVLPMPEQLPLPPKPDQLPPKPDQLPPLPKPDQQQSAKAKSESQTLKPKRRRKKKKKSKPKGLVRVSSRNSINEMDTIEEADEEKDDCDDQYSDYSCSTEDDDSLRQLEIGPTMSTASDSDCDALSPPSFIELEEDPQGGSFTNPTKGAVNPPSPILEEPKIRRLPPPWI